MFSLWAGKGYWIGINGAKMTFKKEFPPEDILKVLSKDEWQKTREIADKVGCKNNLVTDTLLQMPEVEWKWVPGGKSGTREWRLKVEKDVE